MQRYRSFDEADHAAMHALDLAAQRRADPGYDALPAREREGRLCTSGPALKFYERSEHSFLAVSAGAPTGFVLAQAVWQGDRPTVLVRSVVLGDGAPAETAAGLLRAVIKSAYDSAVYEVHYLLTPELQAAAEGEGSNVTGAYAVQHLGTRNATAPGRKLAAAGQSGA